MRRYFLLFALLMPFCGTAQDAAKKEAHPHTFRVPPAAGDKDSMTLKQYYFVMLVTNKDREKISDTAKLNGWQRGHMANINKMAKDGKLMVAGPFGDDGNWRGIFIFDCDTEEEVKQLLAADPLIKAGRLNYELHPWWTAMNSVFK